MSDFPPKRTVRVRVLGVPVFSKVTEYEQSMEVDDEVVLVEALPFGFAGPDGGSEEGA